MHQVKFLMISADNLPCNLRKTVRTVFRFV